MVRADPDARDMRYSGRYTGSVCHFKIRFPGSSGNGANANRKYHFKWLFLKNIPFNQILSGQFRGLFSGRVFCHVFYEVGGGETR